MNFKFIIIIVLTSLLLLIGCSVDYAKDPYVQNLMEQYNQCLSASVDDNKELFYWKTHGIRGENLADEVHRWCFLIITDGEKPSFEDDDIRDMIILNLSNQQIEAWSLEDWKYWLVCDTKYR